MRYTSRLNVPIATIGVAVLATAIVLAYVGVNSGTGGGDEPLTLQEPLNRTPAPPSAPRPTPNPNPPTPFTTPTHTPKPTPLASVEVSGVVIPIPQGARYSYGALATDSWELFHHIWFGDSTHRETDSGLVRAGVVFDEKGLHSAYFEDLEGEVFAPTLDALWVLAQKVGTPSPPSLVVHGADIPLPEGSYYSAIEARVMGGTDTVVSYYARFEHSVLKFTNRESGLRPGVRVVSNSVRPRDATKFQPTLDAIALIAPAD